MTASLGRVASDLAGKGDGSEEGWYKDPFGIREQRWVSKGRPTSLVSDKGVEGQDEPPDRPPSRPFVPATTDDSSFGRDMARADDRDMEPIPSQYDFQEAAYGANAALKAGVLDGRGSVMFESSFEHKMRVRPRRERWKRHSNRLFGGKAK